MGLPGGKNGLSLGPSDTLGNKEIHAVAPDLPSISFLICANTQRVSHKWIAMLFADRLLQMVEQCRQKDWYPRV